MSTGSMTTEQFIELLRKAGNSEAAQVIADVAAMLGQCAALGNGRTIAEINGRYQPKTELGKHIQATVDRELAAIKAKREQRRPPAATQVTQHEQP